MIELYYDDPATRERHRTGPLGPFIDGFAAFLADKHYGRLTARRYLRYTGFLSRWLADSRRGVADVHEALLAEFVLALPESPYVRANKGGFPDVAGGLTLLLRWLRAEHVLPALPPPPSALAPAVEAFEAWMIQHRRVLPETTSQSYRPILVRFIAAVGDQPERYTAAMIRAFILDQAPRFSRKRAKCIVTAVRMFLRFQVTQGRCAAEILGAVPTVAHWKKEGLPKYISVADVDRILSACDRTTTAGRRDLAMLLLLARLGLRAGDVAGVRLSDIDWSGGRLWVCGKGRRREALPLPQDVGDALLAHLVQDRSDSADDVVFVTLHAPRGTLAGTAVGPMVARKASLAGVTLPRGGSHTLRHSLATSLLADGMSLPGIGAVLRHRDLNTTTIYAKVDTELLSSVARAWPLAVTV